MPIIPVPERGQIGEGRGDGQVIAAPMWLEWFRGVFFALFGWKRSFTATANLDFGLIAAGGEAGLTMTVKGARANDAVTITPSAKTAGIIDSVGVVTAVDTVTVYAHNITGAGINPPAKDYRAVVLQQ